MNQHRFLEGARRRRSNLWARVMRHASIRWVRPPTAAAAVAGTVATLAGAMAVAAIAVGAVVMATVGAAAAVVWLRLERVGQFVLWHGDGLSGCGCSTCGGGQYISEPSGMP